MDAPATRAGVFLPARVSLASLRRAARDCRGCPLYRQATQTVFGEGPRSAAMMLVGEQPGNDEDLQGRPFVGPAGRLLDRALLQAGVQRDQAYVSNVVKHFKWMLRGKRRLHRRPELREIEACLPWLQQELKVVRPQVLVCLGATAAQALLGKQFRVTTQRGQRVESSLAPNVVATVHPSSILRLRGEAERHQAMKDFVADLRYAAALV